MTSDNNTSQLSLNYSTTGTLTNIDRKNVLPQVLPMPTTIVVTPNSSTRSARSSTRKHATINVHSLRKSFTRKPQPSTEVTMADIGYRLSIKKLLQTRLTLLSDIMCCLGIFGIILMVTANELTFNRVDNKDTKASWFIKLIISVTTVILLTLLIYYHRLNLKLYSNQNSLDDCYVGLTNTKICLIIIEILICAVHPMPRSYPHSNPPKLNSTSVDPYSLSYIALDVALGLPMFFRLYLLGRCIMYHSHLVRDASLRSISFLNRVSINFFFLMKTYLEQWPARCLFTCCTILFFVASWSYRACDYKPTREHMSMLDAMWICIVTFATIGYGDYLPTSYCGRFISAIVGLSGILSSALVISVLAQKLLLTRAEKYVHTFVLNTELVKEHRYYAANVVIFSVKIWFLKRKNKPNYIQCLQAQRKLFQSVSSLQQIKKQQKSLVDNCVGMHELMAIQRDVNMQHNETAQKITEMKSEIMNIDGKLDNITRNMDTLQASLNTLLDNMKK